VIGDVKEGEEVVTGSYKVLRTIRNGTQLKIDNSVQQRPEEKS